MSADSQAENVNEWGLPPEILPAWEQYSAGSERLVRNGDAMEHFASGFVRGQAADPVAPLATTPDPTQAEREAALKAILNVQDAPFTCGCNYDSGPYHVPCDAHDEAALVVAARAAGWGDAKQQRLYDVAALHSPEREAYERGRGAGYATGRGEAAERIEALEGALRELRDKSRAYSLAESRGDWSMLATTREAFRAAYDTTSALLSEGADDAR